MTFGRSKIDGYFKTVEEMKESNPPVGRLVQTTDYYSTQRGGGASYLIKTAAQAAADGDVIDGYGSHTLSSGNVAIPQSQLFIDPLTYGAVADGVTDDTDPLQAAMNSGNVDFGNASRTYLITSKLITPTLNQQSLPRVYRGNKGSKPTIKGNVIDVMLTHDQPYSGDNVIKDISITGIKFVALNTDTANRTSIITLNDAPITENITISNNEFIAKDGYVSAIGIGVGGNNNHGSATRNVRIEDNEVDVTAAGVEILNHALATSPAGMKLIHIKRNEIRNAGGGNISHASNAGLGVSISGPCQDIFIRDNNLKDCVYAGLEFVNSHVPNDGGLSGYNIHVTGNDFDGNGFGYTVTAVPPATAYPYGDFTFHDNRMNNNKTRNVFKHLVDSTFTGNKYHENIANSATSNYPVRWDNCQDCIIDSNEVQVNTGSSYTSAPKMSDCERMIVTSNIFSSNIGDAGIVLGNPDNSGSYFRKSIFSNNQIKSNNATLTRGIFFCGNSSIGNKGVGNVLESSNPNISPVKTQHSGATYNDIKVSTFDGSKYIKTKVTVTGVNSSGADLSKEAFLTPVQVFTATPGVGWVLTLPTLTNEFTIINNTDAVCTVTTGAGSTLNVGVGVTSAIFIDDSGNVLG